MKRTRVSVLVSYDETVNAAYILLDPDGRKSKATMRGRVTGKNGGLLMIFMDVSDSTGKISGIEVLDASMKLPGFMLGAEDEDLVEARPTAAPGSAEEKAWWDE